MFVSSQFTFTAIFQKRSTALYYKLKCTQSCHHDVPNSVSLQRLVSDLLAHTRGALKAAQTKLLSAVTGLEATAALIITLCLCDRTVPIVSCCSTQQARSRAAPNIIHFTSLLWLCTTLNINLVECRKFYNYNILVSGL